jgi:uncharacterized protein (TIGR03118 family)
LLNCRSQAGKIDVFNSSFAKQTTSATSFTFVDPAIPTGFAPFGIQAINNGANGAAQIYVTYAQQNSASNDATGAAGQGYVDVYDTNGQLIKQLIPAGGALNAPWGLALTPANFGTFGKALLVGNFGDGKINAFNAATGAAMGTISGSSGAALGGTVVPSATVVDPIAIAARIRPNAATDPPEAARTLLGVAGIGRVAACLRVILTSG